jgi:predicted  nucleic acid-binding Zn-ribbon protein
METTVEQKLKALFELQKIDSKIDNIRTLRGELPMEVKDLEDEIAGLETRLQKYNDEIASMKQFIVERKAFIKESNALKAKYEAQLMNVKNSREYDALSKEIEIQGLEVQLAEKKIKEANAQIEFKSNEHASVTFELEGRMKDLQIKKTELDSIIAETEKEEKELQDRSDEAAQLVDDRLVTAYKRIRRNARNGLAVVMVERGSCGGCFNSIPPQRQMDIRTRRKIIVCEHCGRILVDSEIDNR